MLLPEESEMGDTCAMTSLSARSANDAVHCLLNDQIDVNSNIAAYDHLEELSSLATNTDANRSPMIVVAHAVHTNPYWQHRLEHIMKHIDVGN